MLSDWLVEIIKGFGRLLINPLFYWVFILMIISGYERIKRERSQFGFKIFNLFSEWQDTWILSLGAGLILSVITIGSGFVFTIEMIFLLSFVTILLSLHARFTLLSASYTIGITYLIMFLAPLFLSGQTYIKSDLFAGVNFTSIAILLGIFLMIEGILIVRVHQNQLFPSLTQSHRGVWVGKHHLKKLTVIPFFVLIPSGLLEPFADYWPYFSVGGQTYSLLLVPFVLGFDYPIQSAHSSEAAASIGKSTRLLGIIVLAIAMGSIFISWLSVIAVLCGIIGKEVLTYRHRLAEKKRKPFFNQMDAGLKVLAIIPETPADQLGILAGETIYRVNDQHVSTSHEFYEALQTKGAYFKLEVLDEREEVRFVQSAFYDDDHHKLGMIFTEEPHHEQRIG